MSQKPPLLPDPDERIFTLKDISSLFVRLRKKLLRMAFLGGLFFFLFFSTRPVQYKAEATFKEAAERTEEGGLKDLLLTFGGSAQQPQAIALMKSHQVLKPLIEKHGLQACVTKANTLTRLIGRVCDNWRSEWGKSLPEINWFAFQEVRYLGEKPLSYGLRFTDERTFELLDNKGKKLASGLVGKKVEAEGLSFICSQTPSSFSFHKTYPLLISSWLDLAKGLREALEILPHKTNKSIYDLKLPDRNRHRAAALLNGLMEEYRRFLKSEHDQIATEQLAYLEEKQGQIYEKMGKVFDSHAAYLTQSLGEKGVIALEETAESYQLRSEKINNEMLAIERELMQLKNREKWGGISGNNSFLHTFSASVEEMQGLTQQKDLLELAFAERPFSFPAEKQFQELSSIRAQKTQADQLYQAIQGQRDWKELDFPAPFSWASAFSAPMDQDHFAKFLGNQIRLLTVREKTLQERFVHFHAGPGTEFQGITLKLARQLHAEYISRLDAAEGMQRQLAHIQKELQKKQTELSSFIAVLKDPFSLELIQGACKAALHLKDENHRTDKEKERWTQELVLQRTLLANHLEELAKVEALNASLIREKISALQQICLDCINQDISVLDEKLAELARQREAVLQEEKSLLQKEKEELRGLIADLPEKWKRESWLRLKTEMGTKVMQAMTELVESKTISSHLHQVGSKPLDRAFAPLSTIKPRLIQMTFLGGFCAVFAVFFLALVQTLLKGFPLSAEKLQTLRYPFSGKLSSFCDGPSVEALTGPDLETLRQLSLFVESSKIVGLIGGKGPDYSFSFAENLARTGKKVLLIRADFSAKFKEQDRPGLLQWLEGGLEEIPLKKREAFDEISSGGFSPFGVEWLQSSQAELLLEKCKQQYDLILLWLKGPLDLSQTNAALSLSERAIITISGEQTELLTPFIHWGYDRSCLTFVATL